MVKSEIITIKEIIVQPVGYGENCGSLLFESKQRQGQRVDKFLKSGVGKD